MKKITPTTTYVPIFLFAKSMSVDIPIEYLQIEKGLEQR